MNAARRPLLLFLGAILVGASVFFALAAQREAHAARQRVEILQAERAHWSARAATLDLGSDFGGKRIPATAGTLAARIAEISASAAVASASPPTTPGGPTDALAALHLRALEADVRLRCDRFFRARALPAEQVAAFARRVAEANRETMIRWSSQPVAGRLDPSNPNTNALREITQRQNAALEADLIALLGRDAYADYQQFQRTQIHWSHVTSLATQLYRTETPLSPVQVAQLANLLIAQSTTASGNVARQPASWDAVFVQAAAILSPAQLGTFKALKERTDLRHELNRMIFRAR